MHKQDVMLLDTKLSTVRLEGLSFLNIYFLFSVIFLFKISSSAYCSMIFNVLFETISKIEELEKKILTLNEPFF